MNKIVSDIIKKVSNKEIGIKNNYKLFRVLQKIINIPSLKNNNYEDVIFDLEDRKIKARIFYPKCSVKGLIIYIHGGGWVIGSIESYTNTCAEICEITKRPVICIDYRLAPEYPFPNGFNDCYDIIRIIMNEIEDIGVKKENVCLMGDSAGGNLVAAISIKSRKTKDFKIRKQILLYPALQGDYSDKTKYKSVITNGKDYLLTQKQLQEYMSLYVGGENNMNNPLISPLKVRFPFLQPETLIITADNDPLKDEGKEYAKKLRLHFNYVEYYNVKDSMHGFLTNRFNKKNKEIAYEKIINFLGDIDESKK